MRLSWAPLPLLLLFAAPSFAESPSPSDPEVLFTFDDGPSLANTPKILATLEAHGIKSVFFVNGSHFQGESASAERARALLREELAQGHAVGNHTVHHYFLCGRVYSQRVSEEVEGNAELIEQATGVRPDLFRTPYGAHCRRLNAQLSDLGIKPIGWDIDPQDWRLRNAQKIETSVERQLKTLRGRAIVLFHDIQPATAVALPHVLDWIDQENARRVEANEAPIRIVDYAYLVPRPVVVPPLLESFGRLLVGAARQWVEKPVPLCPLAWMGGQV